jgi:aminoglycoside phosphotransferase family enzyme/predicted kinase
MKLTALYSRVSPDLVQLDERFDQTIRRVVEMSRAHSLSGTKKRAIPREQLVRFLLDRRSYRHRPRSVRLIQTHASYVFVAGPYVYKVKKPVNFGFLDFSTLEKRRYFSEREISLNRRLCSDVHLGVVPISLRGTVLTFGPGDTVIEYAVKMRKLEERYLLSQLLKRDKVRRRHLDRVVSALQAFYQSQEPTSAILKWGEIEKLKVSTRENFRQAESFVGQTISATAFKVIRSYTNDFYRFNARLFESRIRERRIRDCHGDLHLDHVHLTPNRLSIYDCIEFNDRLRYIDVASDIAFLAMDFEFQGRRDLSRYFTARMVEVLGDRHLLKLIDFYKCYRAFVRGKVDSLQSAGSKRDRSRSRARRYFQLALQYAVCGSEPMVVIVMGRIASGKSALAKCLSAELGWDVFSSDRTRKQLAGVPLYTRGDITARRQLYSEAMARKTYQLLARKGATSAIEKTGAILDATYSRRRDRDGLRRKLERRGVSYCFVETQAPDSILKRRLIQRAGAPREISDARREDFENLSRSYDPPIEIPANKLITVSTPGALEEVTTSVLQALARHRSQGPAGS